MEHKTETKLVLPVHIVSRVDVGRLLRNAQELDEFLRQAAIREPGTPLKMPKTSHLLDEFISVNKLNALQEADRKIILDFFEEIRTKAPVLHMSFSADPPPSFTQKLIGWIRQEIHPHALLSIGMQPNLGAGTVMRTRNSYFDFSLRQRFEDNRKNLLALINGENPQ